MKARRVAAARKAAKAEERQQELNEFVAAANAALLLDGVQSIVGLRRAIGMAQTAHAPELEQQIAGWLLVLSSKISVIRNRNIEREEEAAAEVRRTVASALAAMDAAAPTEPDQIVAGMVALQAAVDAAVAAAAELGTVSMATDLVEWQSTLATHAAKTKGTLISARTSKITLLATAALLAPPTADGKGLYHDGLVAALEAVAQFATETGSPYPDLSAVHGWKAESKYRRAAAEAIAVEVDTSTFIISFQSGNDVKHEDEKGGAGRAGAAGGGDVGAAGGITEPSTNTTNISTSTSTSTSTNTGTSTNTNVGSVKRMDWEAMEAAVAEAAASVGTINRDAVFEYAAAGHKLLRRVNALAALDAEWTGGGEAAEAAAAAADDACEVAGAAAGSRGRASVSVRGMLVSVQALLQDAIRVLEAEVVRRACPTCQKCGFGISPSPDGGAECERCGHTIPPQHQASSKITSSIADIGIFDGGGKADLVPCGRCGFDCQADAQYCEQCGFTIQDGPPPSPAVLSPAFNTDGADVMFTFASSSDGGGGGDDDNGGAVDVLDWLQLSIDRARAEVLLSHSWLTEGTFLVRKSGMYANGYTLSMRGKDGHVHHYSIVQHSSGGIKLQDTHTVFARLQDLVTHFQRSTSLGTDIQLTCKLGASCPKDPHKLAPTSCTDCQSVLLSTDNFCQGCGQPRDAITPSSSSLSSPQLDKWELPRVRCAAFFDMNLHSRMPLVPTPAHLKRAGV
jgi:hypothetical protein